jgi:hypothetical protein
MRSALDVWSIKILDNMILMLQHTNEELVVGDMIAIVRVS